MTPMFSAFYNFKRLQSVVGVLVMLIILLIGCSPRQEEPTPSPVPLSTTLPTVTLTRTHTDVTPEVVATPLPPSAELTRTTIVEPTSTAVTIAVSRTPLEPVATAARIFPYSWSLDSKMLAYWTFTEEEVAVDYTFPPGTLHFFNADTNETCESSVNVGYGYGSPVLTWLAGGQVQVLVEQGFVQGTPCQDNFAITDDGQSNPSDTTLSPEGNYRISTLEVEENKFVTSIEDVITDEVLNTVEWQALGALGERGTGGQWLENDTFLIQETIEGPLLITADGETLFVASQLFNQSIEDVCEVTPCQTTLGATGALVESTDIYHLILYGKGIESNFLPIRLYHSESGLVEELNFRQHGGFSPDGWTLLLYISEVTENEVRHILWVRPVDPPNSESHLLLTTDANPFPVVWSPNGTKLVASSSKDITIYSVPEGDVIGIWDTQGRATIPTAWSPNSHYLAVQGFSSTRREEALFVVQTP